ncbi:TnsA endonuclease N-terminal domain-containing protein [Photobacterium kishitanii]|uniref:TnsA endonuclease N-terminal domain-containing protein n=1 Tax=Photobacterium kishitanii TaxID=318456 RepID=UPI00071AEFB3|nr:TnsA endonuclease N-terminal domain-containing protein [Photobacterium kishitanii]
MQPSPATTYQTDSPLEFAFTHSARKLTKSRGKNIHRYVSIKMNTIISVESTLEFDACFHFDFNNEISRFCSQPIRYSYVINGIIHSYVPDFLCEFDCGEMVLYEVKAPDAVKSKSFASEFEAKRKYAKKLFDVDLELIEERHIRYIPLLKNLKCIHRYTSHSELTDEQTSILKYLNKHGSTKLETIIAHFSNSKNIIPMIYDLLSKYLINTDLRVPLNCQTELKTTYV